MTNQKLPVTIEPARYAAARREVTGVVSFSKMPRLLPSLAESSGDITVRIEFQMDKQNRVIADMRVRGNLPLTCQRCLGIMQYPVDRAIQVCFVENEAEGDLVPEFYEPWVLTEGQCSLTELVEDELILSVPLVPMHDNRDNNQDCNLMQNQAYYSDASETGDRQHPFAVLAELTKSSKK